MSNLIDIQTQIQKLQKQADEIRSKEFDKTVQDIVGKMQAFGITLKDIQAALGKPRAGKGRAKAAAKKPAARKAGKKTTTPVAAKYRGPSGETWSGRGLMPRWLAALVAQGRKKEEFSIQ
jgi:DNA-binding protein H-NS